ncbi:MAG TPA: diguanylate cyclase [Rhodospirillaceae bacterium]|nr:diguanylate cyclase [Rhodospirillaceae bacterium]
MLDIDHFKTVNDTYGHAVGDQVLVELSGLLRSSLRSADSLTRWGGEEFIILCPGTTLPTAIVLAERLRGIVDGATFTTVGDVKISLGVAECQSGEDWQQWFTRADAALYKAKANGRNQVQFAPETFAGDPESPSADLIQLSWRQAYASGDKSIDREHQGLFSIANALLCAILSGNPSDDIKRIIHVLVGELTAHFKNEETVIAAAGFPGLEEHQDLHRLILKKADQLLQEFAADTAEIGAIFQFLAHDVVARHMLVADYEFFPYLVRPPQSQSPDRFSKLSETVQ